MIDPATACTDSRHPSREQVCAALDRVLASEPFTTAARSKDFLRFVVTETLDGRGTRLKGYSIAISVFGRSVDFDAQANPIVRVEARRLRQRLARYYAGRGRGDPVRIELPPGGYRPSFTARAAEDGPRRSGADDGSARTLVRRAAAAWRTAIAAWRSLITGGPGRRLKRSVRA